MWSPVEAHGGGRGEQGSKRQGAGKGSTAAWAGAAVGLQHAYRNLRVQCV